VTVLKGPLAKGKVVKALGSWEPFGRGAVREARVNLKPQAAQALAVRVVELRRGDAAAPVATRYVTTAAPAQLITVEVAEAYLGRWPYQEDLFRRGRNGLGLERSAGYGAAEVSHVALLDQRDSAQRRRERAEQAYAQALEAEFDTAETARRRLEQLQHQAEAGVVLDERHTRPAREALERYHYRQQDTDQAEQRLHELKKSCRKLAEQPETIYVRDTALDIIWALRECLSWQVAVACFTLPPS
jgi:plasmid stabilization system protein ParE